MPLQPHAQQQIDEQVTLLARAFKAGYKSAAEKSNDPIFAGPDFSDFIRFVESVDIITAYYVRQELFNVA